jgi:hypothetical protein
VGVEGAEDVHRPRQVAVQELDRDQVEDDAKRPRQVVLGLAGGARVVAHGNLREPCTMLLRQNWNEAVHLAVERQRFG